MNCNNAPMRLVAVSAVSAFVLTACSSTQAFDFTAESFEPSESIEFRVPEELLEKAPEYAERRVLDSVILTSVEPADASRCAVQYEFVFVDGGLERLLGASESHDGSGTPTQFAFRSLTGESEKDADLEEDFSSAVVEMDCAASPSDDDKTVSVSFFALTEDESDTSANFARVEVAAMQSGELFVHEIYTRGWELDSDGNWVS